MKPIAYLISEYPAVSHTFIFREIQVLRDRGLQIETISVNPVRHPDVLDSAYREEARGTLVIKEQSLFTFGTALIRSFCSSPLGFLRMLSMMVWLGIWGPCSPVKAIGYFFEAVLLVPWLRERRIQHIHEHFANPTAIVAMLLQRYGGFTYSISLHGPDVFYSVDKFLLKEKLAGATFIRCISYYCQSQVMRLLGPDADNLHIVRCGIDPDHFQARPKATNERPRLLCVGRLCAAKGQAILIQACAYLEKLGIAFELNLVGDGERRASLVRLASDLGLSRAVNFKGALGQKAVHREYQEADLFILPTFAEGLPVVLMEAMAMEIPTITTPVNGIPELIENNANGILVPPSSVERLATAIQNALSDMRGLSRIAKTGRETVLRDFDQRKNNAALADIFLQYGATS